MANTNQKCFQKYINQNEDTDQDEINPIIEVRLRRRLYKLMYMKNG